MFYKTDNIRIVSFKPIISPNELIEKYPLSEKTSETIFNARKAIKNIMLAKDNRLLVVIGPCSIHDPKSALEYAAKLNEVRKELKDSLLIVMRTYFEKPRTTIGWKGLINDPDLDNSFHLDKGLDISRSFLLELAKMGMPASAEFLDLITSPQYLADLLSWGAIGARTTESQLHRELVSGLSCPIGFKNGTDGNISIAMDAIISAGNGHSFFATNKTGVVGRYFTSGNKECHLILRGGKKPNYEEKIIKRISQKLKKANLTSKVMVDLSHGNSEKQFKNQIKVGENIANQIKNGTDKIFGVMIESYLKEGNQKIAPIDKLEYGKSITDACLGWDDSKKLLYTLADATNSRNS